MKCEINTSQVFFDVTRQDAVPEVLSQKDASRNDVSDSFHPGIGIANTTPLQPNFRSLFHSETFSKKDRAERMYLCLTILH
jgi:hypothetical protein